MAKHQLIISKKINGNFPVRSEEERFNAIRTLVVNWKGTWEPRERPDLFLVVAPGDELEVVLADEQHEGGSFWLFNRESPSRPLLVPLPEGQRLDGVERVDLQKGSVILTVDPTIAKDAGESRYNLRVSVLGMPPAPFVGQGQAGTLIASKP
ncbi:hypothetical protein [Archangium violaceum]|uniref:Uncharacterized protein n=1 Tax=Archangium violaceum Cb vi76 TaxID=1406225 RepID=A0A084SUM3_9BACT|nr:hypothetical protein [Archangium violaceum]KFA92158.1 hypothetical protein Q664_17845 [Archangium violaceum Cb vi76]